ncbi:hypothetical protein TNCV_5103731 [Trichonephila clavipes]|nr:hypothetical protein TNCV_5103731 [Trichonephila clavipes]
MRHRYNTEERFRVSDELEGTTHRIRPIHLSLRHNYRRGGIMVWAEISLGDHTDLHVVRGGILTGVRYRGGHPKMSWWSNGRSLSTYTRAFGDGPRNFEALSSDENDTLAGLF